MPLRSTPRAALRGFANLKTTTTHRRSQLAATSTLGLLLLGITALVALSGCSKFEMDKFDMSKNIPWGAGKDGELKAPMKVVAVWTDTVLTEGMRPATRGFGGRLMFYDVDGGKPIKVKGSLTVYAFDETGRDVEQAKPDRKYVFTSEQFEKHYSKSSLGHSYSVWLPWDAAGGPLKEISLLVRFTPDNAPVVIGEAAKQHLPGVRTGGDPTKYPDPAIAQATNAGQVPTSAVPGVLPHIAVGSQSGTLPNATLPSGALSSSTVANGGVQLVGYDAPAAQAGSGTTAQPRRMSTTTISLPSSNDALRRTSFAQPGGNFGSAPMMTTAPGSAASAFGSQGPMGWPAAQQVGSPQAGSTQPAAPAAGSQPAAWQSPAVPQSPKAGSQSAHFGPGRHRPLGAPLARLERDRAPWQPNLAAPPSAPPSSR